MSVTNEKIMFGGSRVAFYFIDEDEDYYEYEIVNVKTRYCNRTNYNDFYYANNHTVLFGFEKDIPDNKKENIFNNINFIGFSSGEKDIENYTSTIGFNPSGEEFLLLFKYIKNDNYKLEEILFENFDLSIYPEFINVIKLLKGLKIFSVRFDCKLENNQLIEMMRNLSCLKYFFLLDLNFKIKLNLNKKTKKALKRCFLL